MYKKFYNAYKLAGTALTPDDVKRAKSEGWIFHRCGDTVTNYVIVGIDDGIGNEVNFIAPLLKEKKDPFDFDNRTVEYKKATEYPICSPFDSDSGNMDFIYLNERADKQGLKFTNFKN